MKSVMAHSFSQNPKVEIPRSTFDRSFGYKTTFDAGYLILFLIVTGKLCAITDFMIISSQLN